MTVDFVHPRAHKGMKSPENLVTACRPGNLIKGHRVFRDFERAKAHVLPRGDELGKDWEAKTASQRTKSAPA
jgi:5-methylcytosine-specific restriction endonuclease McrA